MPNYYFDSSALVKYYHQEPGSPDIIGLIQTPNTRHYISRLTFVEVHSAFGGKVRSGHIDSDQFDLFCDRLRQDVYERRFRVLPMKAAHYREAERLLKTYTADKGLRTLDSLQLSVALLDLYRESRLAQFICADRILSEVATAEGMTVLNPIGREQEG
jgi:predicted nucleic acid-binding protein